jgi:hypothetical protein
MKNKILIAILIIGLLSIYPMWRYYSHAKIFAESVLIHAGNLGKWTHGSINSSLDGKITIRNLNFVPKGYKQSFTIDNIVITTNPLFLFKSKAINLNIALPETMSISINSAQLDYNSNDISQQLQANSYWMLMAGYAGSFGCKKDFYTSFNDNTWTNLFDKSQIFNADLFYSKQSNGSLDVDLVLDAENLFSTTWSSNLKSTYYEKQIVLDELIVDKLYYNFLDNGFNLKRNNACKENYNSSFAAYRISSADHVQKYLRSYFTKELPTTLINIYQRMLEPNVEYNAIFNLDNSQYLSEIYKSNQRDFYENSSTEIATRGNNYIPVNLEEIDFTVIDTELLKKENLKREQQDKQAALDKLSQKKDINKPIIYTTGTKTSRNLPINMLHTAINKKIRIKTVRGRPITGLIRGINNDMVSIETRYKTGFAKLLVPISSIASIELLR